MLAKLWRCFFVWDYVAPKPQELRSAALIVTQAWSRRIDGRIGQGNQALARVTKALTTRYSLPVFAQVEVAEADPTLKPVGVVRGSGTGRSDFSWNTYTVAEEQVKYCREQGLRRVIVVAHPLHMPRALWVYRSLGLDPIPAPVSTVSGYEAGLAHGWFFRFEPLAYVYELTSRLIFLYQGWI